MKIILEEGIAGNKEIIDDLQKLANDYTSYATQVFNYIKGLANLQNVEPREKLIQEK